MKTSVPAATARSSSPMIIVPCLAMMTLACSEPAWRWIGCSLPTGQSTQVIASCSAPN
jgi:hypothetical protein